MSPLITMLTARLGQVVDRTDRERGAITVEYGVLIIAVGLGLLGAATVFFTGLGGWLQGLIADLPG